MSIGFLVALITGIYTGYVFFKKPALEEELKASETAFNRAQNDLVKYEGQNVTEAIAAKQTLEELKLSIIKWSEVIRKIRQTIPKNDKDEPIVSILSYSGSGNNEISMSVRTNASSETPYFDVADFIKAFDESKNFLGGFVPSISKSKDKEGREALTFTFSTRYQEEQVSALVEEDLGEEVNEVLNESLEPVTQPVTQPVEEPVTR